VLPPRYVPVYVGGNPFYYNEGVYYRPSAGGYEVVSAPYGAIVYQLPPGSQTLNRGGETYYRYRDTAGNEVYYQKIMYQGRMAFMVVSEP